MYWGEVSKVSEEGIPFQFSVVEQTEFIDDASFQPFKGENSAGPATVWSLYRRCYGISSDCEYCQGLVIAGLLCMLLLPWSRLVGCGLGAPL